MKVATKSVRLNMPVQIGVCTLRNQAGVAIDCTLYDEVFCELKVRGVVYETVTGAYVLATAGTVRVLSYKHTVAGEWMAQFYVRKSADHAAIIFGEPIRYLVSANVEDCGLDVILAD